MTYIIATIPVAHEYYYVICICIRYRRTDRAYVMYHHTCRATRVVVGIAGKASASHQTPNTQAQSRSHFPAAVRADSSTTAVLLLLYSSSKELEHHPLVAQGEPTNHKEVKPGI